MTVEVIDQIFSPKSKFHIRTTSKKMSGANSSNISYQQHTNATRVDSRTSRLYSQLDEELDDSSICGGLCCKPGLVIGILSCIYVIFVLPCGLFLMMVGGPKSYILLLIGFGAIFLPLLVFALVCVVVFVRRRRRKRAVLHRQMKETPDADFV